MSSLRTADAFPVVASLPPKNSYFFVELLKDKQSNCDYLFSLLVDENRLLQEELIKIFSLNNNPKAAVFLFLSCTVLAPQLPAQ